MSETSIPKPRSMMWRCLQSLASILTRVFLNLQVRGTHHLPKTGGVLIVSNHQSYIDPVVIAVRFDRPFAFLADAYLFKIKPFAWLIRRLNAFPINTDGRADVGAMKETIRLLQAGEVLNVFPEGTRTHTGKIDSIQGGVALAIRRAKVPVMPAVIVGAYESFSRHSIFPRTGKVRVIFDSPRRLDHLKADEIVTHLQDEFSRLYDQAIAWREESR